MDKRKMTIKIYTKLHRKLKFEQNAFHKGSNSGRVCSSFSTGDTHLVTITIVCPSFRNILVNTLESTSFNGF